MLITVQTSDAGKRLDKLLSEHFSDYSRTYFQNLIEKSLVVLNGKIAKKRDIPLSGDKIEITFEKAPEIALEAENIPLDILYEDDEIIAINKPVGMVVHPGAGNHSHTFVNALLYHCSSLKNDSVRSGIVHRLDKETSGVLLAAKNEIMQEKLSRLFATRQIEKEYKAITIGNPGTKTIKTCIGRHPIHRQKMTVLEIGGKEAVTHVTTTFYKAPFAFVSLHLETGRTHQLRVHLKHNKTPILGDPVYGNVQLNKKYEIKRPLLHAYRLAFLHPTDKKRIEIIAPLPEDIMVYAASHSTS